MIMNDLRNHIAALNAKTREWVNAGEGRWATTLVEDPSHWAEYGVTTPLEFDWLMQAECYADVYKSAYGHKPYWPERPTTDAALEASIDEMQKGIDQASAYAREQEKLEEAEAVYQRQLEGERTPAVEAALQSSGSGFTIGEQWEDLKK
tara:strand:+ start:2483 stop:2929 length:447 start_codon:yes stop_codon:yes gene_type:complete